MELALAALSALQILDNETIIYDHILVLYLHHAPRDPVPFKLCMAESMEVGRFCRSFQVSPDRLVGEYQRIVASGKASLGESFSGVVRIGFVVDVGEEELARTFQFIASHTSSHWIPNE